MDGNVELDCVFGVSATRWGVPPAVVRARMEVCSFVSTRHRYLYVMTPKVGCTTIKHMMAGLERAPLRAEVVPQRQRESKRGMLIHDQQALPLPHLTTLAPEQAAAVLRPEGDYLRFAFVRNPYSRLFSAWNNKLRFVEPSYAAVAAAIRGGGGDETAPIAFAEFADYVCGREDPVLSDHHWALQTALLFPGAIPYSFICPIEDIGRGLGLWRGHLERVTGRRVEMPATPRNVSLPENWRLAYDQRRADQVYDYFSEDFRAFGYDRESWKQPDGAEERRSAAAEALLACEIIERNRMIDLLYDKIDEYADIICYYHTQMADSSRQLDQARAKVADYAAQVRKLRAGVE